MAPKQASTVKPINMNTVLAPTRSAKIPISQAIIGIVLKVIIMMLITRPMHGLLGRHHEGEHRALDEAQSEQNRHADHPCDDENGCERRYHPAHEPCDHHHLAFFESVCCCAAEW